MKNGETVSTHGRVNRRTIRKPMPMQVSSHHSLHKIQVHLEGEEVYYPYNNTLCLNTEKSFLLSAWHITYRLYLKVGRWRRDDHIQSIPINEILELSEYENCFSYTSCWESVLNERTNIHVNFTPVLRINPIKHRLATNSFQNKSQN